MKKTFFLKSSAIALISLLMVACGKKADPTPALPITAKVFTSVVSQGTVANGLANVTGTVTISDGTAYLKLIGTSNTNIDHVYITTSQDNGSMSGFVPTANDVDSLGNTFNAGGTSGASYKVNNTKNFVLIIPVPVRTNSSAVSDVYRIWFTNGNGAFTLPTKNLILGPVLFTLNYVANAGPSYSTNTNVILGDQYAIPGSLLVTAGQISALHTSEYDSSATSADIALCELNTGGTYRTGTANGGAKGSGALYFVSPSNRANLGYVSEPAGPNITYISAISTIDFDAATGTTLQNLSVGTKTQIAVVNGNTYQFITTNGKKGLIKVMSLTPTTDGAGGTVNVSVKVLN